MKFDDYSRNYAHIKLMVKGPIRTGKTRLAASASRLWRTYLFDTEGGALSAREVIDPGLLEIEPIVEPSPKAFLEAVNTKLVPALFGSHPAGKFECVIVDSFSEIIARMEEEYATTREDGTLGIKDWGKLMERARRLGRILRDAPVHTIVTCHTKPVSEADGTKMYDTVLPGKCGSEIPGMFQTVAMTMRRLRAPNTPEDFVLVTSGNPVYLVGDRTGVLSPSELIDRAHPEEVLRKLATGLAKPVAVGV